MAMNNPEDSLEPEWANIKLCTELEVIIDELVSNKLSNGRFDSHVDRVLAACISSGLEKAINERELRLLMSSKFNVGSDLLKSVAGLIIKELAHPIHQLLADLMFGSVRSSGFDLYDRFDRVYLFYEENYPVISGKLIPDESFAAVKAMCLRWSIDQLKNFENQRKILLPVLG